MTATASLKTAKFPLDHPLAHWHQATWQNYVALRDAPMYERIKLAFNQG